MKYYLSFALITCLTFQLFAQDLSESKPLPKEVLEAIHKRIENGYAPSIAIALIDSTGTYFYNFGKTKADGSEIDEHTIYEIGSISKVFTGILLAQQILDGDLKVDDKINDFLPDSVKVPVMGNQAITFGHLSDHTSGLPRLPSNFSPANLNNPYADYTVKQLYDFIANYTPTREVGSQYEYSNLAQGLLGHILAENKHMVYEELMIQTIADPLEMQETRIVFSKKMKEHLAYGHSANMVVENWDIPTLAGAGAIRSSTSDMAKFIAANLHLVESPIISAMNLSHEKRHEKARGMGVGLGWHIKKGENGEVYWHNGGTGGYRSFAGFVKETGTGIVVLTNSDQSSEDIGMYLLDPGSTLADIRFKNEAIEVEDAILDQYVGVYKLAPRFKIIISKKGQQLFARATDQSQVEIYPETETTFFYTVVDAKITFQLKKGKVKSLTLFQNGKEIKGKKVE